MLLISPVVEHKERIVKVLTGFKPTDMGFKPTEMGFKPTEMEFKPTEMEVKPTEMGFKPRLLWLVITSYSVQQPAIISSSFYIHLHRARSMGPGKLRGNKRKTELEWVFNIT